MTGNSRCNYLYPDFRVCRVKASQHGNLDHDFLKKPSHKTHLRWRTHRPSQGKRTYCGWMIEWVPESTGNVTQNNVARLIRQNKICLLCVKSWLWQTEREGLFREFDNKIVDIRRGIA